ncbi:hypothetical protein [Vreelandella zhaodongensis]|uniref:hypothetical protein n=1 Tax=Vreelandella zhaodongensis TaxID=1176240 RepID=UPI003EBEC9AE
MKTTRLGHTDIIVTYGWVEANDRRSHELWVHIEEYTIEVYDGIAWLDGDRLEEAKQYGEVPSDTQPNWYIALLDDEGGLDSISSEPDLNTPMPPLTRFIQEELDRKLTALRVMGRPRETLLQPVYVPGRPTGFFFRAEGYREGVLINPVLPDEFEHDDHQSRNKKVERPMRRLTYFHWLNQPYILSHASRAQEDTDVFSVFCLEEISDSDKEGYATNCWGSTGNLEEALEIARQNRQQLVGGGRLYEY